WEHAQDLLDRPRDYITDTRLQGTLSAQRAKQTHEIQMCKGKLYMLALESETFHPVLRVYDPKGLPIGGHSGGPKKIIWKGSGENGICRAEVACAPGGDLGSYTLRIREFSDSPLAEQRRVEDQIARHRQAVDSDPKAASAHQQLVIGLLMNGYFAESAAACQKALDLLPPMDGMRAFFVDRLKQAKKLEELDKRLPQVLQGKDKASAFELRDLAVMCSQNKKCFVTAVRLFEEALEADFQRKDYAAPFHRMAAASAIRAAGGKGPEGRKVTELEKEQFRNKALRWTEADLELIQKCLKEGNVWQVYSVLSRLESALVDQDFRTVREPEDLALLPAGERQAWQNVWIRSRELLENPGEVINETCLEGSLTREQSKRVHEVRLVAGKGYILDLDTSSFDPVLCLLDPEGKRRHNGH